MPGPFRRKSRCRLNWWTEKTNRNVWDHLVEREEPVSGKDIADVVQSLDRNLRQVVTEAVSEVDQFLTAPR